MAQGSIWLGRGPQQVTPKEENRVIPAAELGKENMSRGEDRMRLRDWDYRGKVNLSKTEGGQNQTDHRL